jgi:hypothetical protein
MAQHIVKESGDAEMTLEEMKAEQEMLHEKAERKRLESFWWAAVIIWAGLIFIADYFNALPEIGGANAWSWIFLGAGAFGLIGALIRVVSADMPKPTGWDYFWSVLFLIIGAVGFFGAGIAFPIVLVVVGIAILANVLFRRD